MFAFLSTPVDTCLLSYCPHPSLCSLKYNDIGAEGASALAAILKETQITQLKCAAARVFAFVSMPTLTRLLSHHLCSALHTHSLGDNQIRAEGASALAAILKETQITNLECATAPEFTFMSMPLDTRLLALFPTPTFTAWTPTSSVASTMMVTASTPLRASPSCARGSRGAP